MQPPRTLHHAAPVGPTPGVLPRPVIPPLDRAVPRPAVVHKAEPSPHCGVPACQHRRMPPEPEPLPPVLHRSALIAAGYTDNEIRSSTRNGAWATLHRGTYCAADSLPTMSPEQVHRLRARGVAARSPHLVLSHLSAAAVLRLPIWGARLDAVQLTRIGDGGGRIGPGRVVHAAHLEPDEVTTSAGVPVTGVARTLVDLACTVPFTTTVIAADFALHHRLVAPADLARALTGTRHRRGAAGARRALLFADGRSESPGESRTRVAMAEFGLPAPILQVRVYGPTGTFIGRTDLGYPELGVLFEFDGLVKYRKLLRPGEEPSDVVVAEKRREDLIRDMGFVVVRLRWAELDDPVALLAKINSGIARGRRVVGAGGILGSWAADPPLRIPG